MGKAPKLPDQLWHSTARKFETFDERFQGAAVENSTTYFGFYFTEDREDALEWGYRDVRRNLTDPYRRRHLKAGIDESAPIRLLSVKLSIESPKVITATKFQFYLQRAKPSTIQRDRKSWIEAGHDGIVTSRGGHTWWAPFQVDQIKIVGEEALPSLSELKAASKREASQDQDYQAPTP